MWFILNIAATIWFVFSWQGSWNDQSIMAAFTVAFTALIGIASYKEEK